LCDDTTSRIAPRPVGALDAPAAGRAATAVLVLIILLPVALLVLTGIPKGETVLLAAGRTTGAIGLALLLMQPVLSGRLGILDRPIGHDRLIRRHRALAVLAVLLLLIHPVLLALGYGSTWLFRLDAPWFVNLGKVAAVLLIGVVGAALGRRAIRLDYGVWRAAHRGAFAVGVVAFVHAWEAGTGLAMSMPLRFYFGALLATALCIVIWRGIGVPLLGRRRFVVRSVQRESHNVCTLEVQPAGRRTFCYLPGQFGFLRFIGRRIPREEHPFTISSSPTRPDALTFTVKACGDYTALVEKIVPGDTGLLEGPLGRFSAALCPDARGFVMVAGGVGITPIISMLRYLRDTGDPRPVTVILANRTEEDILFRDELDSLPPTVRICHILSRAGGDWLGPRGHVDEDFLRGILAEGSGGREFFVCGPPGMMRSLSRDLGSLGVPRGQIHTERFAL
jgi:predicted ferric reductase